MRQNDLGQTSVSIHTHTHAHGHVSFVLPFLGMMNVHADGVCFHKRKTPVLVCVRTCVRKQDPHVAKDDGRHGSHDL